MSETSSKSVLKTARQVTSRCSRSFCLSALLILAAAAAHDGQSAKQPVVVAQHGTVSAVGDRSVASVSQDGKDVWRVFVQVSLCDGVHRPFHSHLYPLSGLVAAVAQDSPADVAFPQVGHIDECHPSGTVAEQEQVAGHGQGRVLPKPCPVK